MEEVEQQTTDKGSFGLTGRQLPPETEITTKKCTERSPAKSTMDPRCSKWDTRAWQILLHRLILQVWEGNMTLSTVPTRAERPRVVLLRLDNPKNGVENLVDPSPWPIWYGGLPRTGQPQDKASMPIRTRCGDWSLECLVTGDSPETARVVRLIMPVLWPMAKSWEAPKRLGHSICNLCNLVWNKIWSLYSHTTAHFYSQTKEDGD